MSFRPEPPAARPTPDRRAPRTVIASARSLRVIVLLALAAFSVIASCTDILGIPDRTYTGGAGGAGGAGGTGGATGCTKDADCLTSLYGQICDTQSGACVECLPGPDDTCAFGLYCDTTKACFLGCADDTDCNQGGQDGPLTCDVATHQCQGCGNGALCPPGSKCNEDTKVCVSGCDTSPECPTQDWQCCTGQCKNTTKDVQNCGACDDPCVPADSTTWLCLDGGCVFQSCLTGYADCDQNLAKGNGCEVSTQTDAENCGKCGEDCDLANAGAVCKSGACAVGSCNAPFQNCDGIASNGCEANLQTDAASCGGCGQSCDGVFPNAVPTCDGGDCVFGGCEAGFGDCNGIEEDGCEVDLNDTVQHCGGCGDACDVPNAVPVCAAGDCGIGTCDTGFADCDMSPANGCEVNLNSNPQHCKACGAACMFANAAGVCNGGDCELGACNDGFEDCDGNPANGCETNTQINAGHCGGCGQACGTQNASAAVCVAGVCQITCNAPYDNCDDLPANGCETNLLSNVNHCQTCGNVCSGGGGTANCVSGTCGTSMCQPNKADCDGNGSCETDTNTPANCGGCGTVCSTNHTTQVACTGSPLACLPTCEAGWGNCNNNPADGCEQPLTTNQHCTACGTVCQAANANTSCATGSCEIISCQPGYANCNGNPLDGCEAHLATDESHCGACNKPCDPDNANGQCTMGACQIQSCDSGYLDCNNSPNDGCEVDQTSDVFNCGTCGNTCSFPNAQASCVFPGTCQIGSCNGNFNNCDGMNGNGCEANTQTSLLHCGGCNNACSSVNGAAMCSLGMCSINCNSGWDDCNNVSSDGCETNLKTLMDCGACFALCDLPNAMESCNTGMCTFVACDVNYANCNQVPGDGCECGPSLGCAGMMCQGSGTFCGDGTCDMPLEDCFMCPMDCGTCPTSGSTMMSFCGDGTCTMPLEDCMLCPMDCGTCPTGSGGSTMMSFCGDGTCTMPLEDCMLCPMDCGTCPTGAGGSGGSTMMSFCGDGTCTMPLEDCVICPMDCGACPTGAGGSTMMSFCGDGTCDMPTEDCVLCPRDCGACPTGSGGSGGSGGSAGSGGSGGGLGGGAGTTMTIAK